jgi:hypothetical protein
MTSAGPGGAYPAWDGVPREELPLRFPFGLALIALLKDRRGFPAGEVLAQTLNRGAVSYLRGGLIEVDERGDTSVTLWVPAFTDQQADAHEREEPAEHVPLGEGERWEIAELAFAALGAAMPDRVVHFGFLTPESSFALDWHEYCRHYPYPPEYALGYWEWEEG